MEAFVRPRVGPSHWSARCNYPVDGVVQTGDDEMSLYVAEYYAQPGNQVRRYSLRLDGFSSVRAPHRARADRIGEDEALKPCVRLISA